MIEKKCMNCLCPIFSEYGKWWHSRCDLSEEYGLRNGYCTCGCKEPEPKKFKWKNWNWWGGKSRL